MKPLQKGRGTRNILGKRRRKLEPEGEEELENDRRRRRRISKHMEKGLRNLGEKTYTNPCSSKLQSNIFHSHQSLLFIVKGVTTLQKPSLSPLSRLALGL